MATANCFEKDGKRAGTVDLPAGLFGTAVKEHLIHQAVVTYLANQRQGTASTKERSDVAGGGRKPHRQKGTGRARAGTIRSPLHRGGGTVFGPHPRSYNAKLTKKVRRLALTSSLSSRAASGDVLVIKDLEFAEPKTRELASIVKGVGVTGAKLLLVLEKDDMAAVKSARNIPGIRTLQADMVNVYDVMWADKILFTAGAIGVMEEVFSS